MYKTKNSLAMAIALSVILLLCNTVGIAFAQDRTNLQEGMIVRVAQILGISQQKLMDAFKQAQTEFEEQRIAKLVQEGKITQQQADQLKAWESARPAPKTDQQKIEAWMKARPKIAALEPPIKPNLDEMLAKLVKDGKITQTQADQLKAWEAAKPDPKTDPQKFEAWLKAKPDVPLPKPERPPPGGFPHGGFPPDFPMQVPPPPTP